MSTNDPRFLRRRFLRHTLFGGAALVLGCGSATRTREDAAVGPGTSGRSPAGELPPPAAPPPDDHGGTDGGACVPTEPNIEGPFYRAGAPERSILAEPGVLGTALVVAGRVLSPGCGAVAGARMEIWHADHEGAYDNRGYTFRGELRADAEGRYRFDTIVPGRYLNGDQYRPAHIHVKVHVPDVPVLTTQLYFEGDPYNSVDPFIRQSLVMSPRSQPGGGLAAGFDFVVG